MANASGIDHAQGSITLRASFLWVKRMMSRTAQPAIGSGSKVLARHPVPLPGGSVGGQPIVRNWGGGENRGRQRSGGGAGKPGAAQASQEAWQIVSQWVW